MAEETKTASWREKLKTLGKENFVASEMARLGFLKISQEQIDELQKGFNRLSEINQELWKIRKELEGVEDITPIIKEIRQNRIERVRAKRALQRIEKQKAKDAAREKYIAQKSATPYYLGDGVSAGLNFEKSDEAKLKANGLLILHTVEDVAKVSGLDMPTWNWLAYHRRAASLDHYSRFQIPKKKGGVRNIASPKQEMRQAQAWILTNILSKRADATASNVSFAFQKSKNIRQNAEKHLNKNFVVRMDLKDFFPSIKFRRVKGMFHKLGYNEGLATVFALVCTDAMRVEAKLDGKTFFVALGERFLPQGACTSPAITNILASHLDKRLTAFCKKHDWTYTRYADDLNFSTDTETPDMRQLLGVVNKIIVDEGFEVNTEKTLVMRAHQRQSVTGVIVNNEQPKISQRDVKKFRALLHHIDKDGVEAVTKKLGKNAAAYARGYLAYLMMINPKQAEKFKAKYKWLSGK
jgi:RNA-directed DNA polymerase